MSDVNNILNMVEQYKIVPVIAIDSEEQAVPLADALIKGGLPLAEITFRTPAAAAAISRIKLRKTRNDHRGRNRFNTGKSRGGDGGRAPLSVLHRDSMPI